MFDQESIKGQAIGSIFSRLEGDESTKKKGRLVCRDWKYILDKYFLKFHALLSDSTVSFIRNSTIYFDTLTVQDLAKDVNFQTNFNSIHRNDNFSSPSIDNLYSVGFPNKSMDKQEETGSSRYPACLMFRQGNSSATTPSITEQNIEKILWKFQNVRSLIFDENALKFVRQLNVENLALDNLVHLMISLRNRKIDVVGQNDETGNILCQLSKIKMPCLNNLRLDSLLLSGDGQNAVIYASLFDFLANHSSSIRYFALRHCFRPYSNSNEIVTELNLPWTTEKLEAIRQDLSNISLKELTLFLDKYEGLGQFTLGLDLLASQYYLTKLEIHISDHLEPSHTSMIYNSVQRAVERNLSTLRHLTISRNSIKSSISDLQDILRAIYHYSDLETLRLFVFTIPNFPYKLPPTLKTLELMGILDSSLLYDISCQCPLLRHLQFANLTDEYLKQQQQTSMLVNLKRVLTMMPKLRTVKWHCSKLELSMSFLSGIRGISIKTAVCNAYSSIITCN